MDTILPGLDFDCIIANNDAMAIGAILAMEDAGLDAGSVPIVGIDATEDAKEEIRSGKMAMTVFQSASGQAEGSVQAAINLSKEKTWHRTPAVKFPLTTPTPFTSPLSPSLQRMSTNSECRQILNINEF